MAITVVPYDLSWPDKFKTEAEAWQAILKDITHQIHHVGSTAVPGLAAKSIIDMLIEVPTLDVFEDKKDQILALGYEIKGEYGILGRRYFRKGKPKRSHHVHAYQKGDSNIIRHLAFRDYLIAHPAVAYDYGILKRQIVEWVGNDRRAYSAAKHSFIQEQEARARDWWGRK